MAEKRYFAVRECVFNKRWFPRFGFFSEGDLTRGLGPLDKPQIAHEKDGRTYQGSRYMVQIHPTPKDREPDIQALLDEAINDLEGEIAELRTAGSGPNPARGTEARIKKLTQIVEQVRAA